MNRFLLKHLSGIFSTVAMFSCLTSSLCIVGSTGIGEFDWGVKPHFHIRVMRYAASGMRYAAIFTLQYNIRPVSLCTF